MHITVGKLLIETIYWTHLMLIANFGLGLFLYYLTVFIGTTPGIGELI
jgi:hypothetical protein